MKTVAKQLSQFAKVMGFEVVGGFKNMGKEVGKGVTELPKKLIADLLGRQWDEEAVKTEGAHTPLDVEKLMRKNDKQQAAEIMHRLHSQFKQQSTPQAEIVGEQMPTPKKVSMLPMAQGKQNLRGSVLKGTQKRRAQAMQLQDNRTEFSKAGKLG